MSSGRESSRPAGFSVVSSAGYPSSIISSRQPLRLFLPGPRCRRLYFISSQITRVTLRRHLIRMLRCYDAAKLRSYQCEECFPRPNCAQEVVFVARFSSAASIYTILRICCRRACVCVSWGQSVRFRWYAANMGYISSSIGIGMYGGWRASRGVYCTWCYYTECVPLSTATPTVYSYRVEPVIQSRALCHHPIHRTRGRLILNPAISW